MLDIDLTKNQTTFSQRALRFDQKKGALSKNNLFLLEFAHIKQTKGLFDQKKQTKGLRWVQKST